MEETLRRRPTQDRSAHRLDLILDTTATLVDEVGISGVSPTLIARTAHMTGPAIYRYFADMDSVFRSLVARNLERYLRALQQLLADPNIEWQDAVGKAVDIYAEMFRTEPGFARLRIGDALGSAVLSDEVSNARVVAAAAIRQFQPRYETWDRPMMTERIEVMVHVVFALVARAFECESAGDRFFIDEAKRLSVSYLEDFLASVPGTDPAAAPATTPGA